METVKTAAEDFSGGKQSPSADLKDRISADNDAHDATHDANDAGEVDVEALLNRPRRPFSLRMGRRSMYEAPEFVRRLSAFEEAEAGSTVIFECQWKGFPRPAVKWYKDDEEVTENPRFQTTAGDNGVLALVIEEASKADEGAYKCKAENQEGVASTTGYLSVSGEVTQKPLAAQPRKNADHSVSSAPPLRTIMEQRTLEAEEEEELSQQPPSPIQDFIDKLPLRMRGKSRKKSKGDSQEGDGESSGSDTSVDSQDFDRVPDRDKDFDPDLDTKEGQTQEATPQEVTAGPQTQQANPVQVVEIHNNPQGVQNPETPGTGDGKVNTQEGQNPSVNPQIVTPQVMHEVNISNPNPQPAQEVQQSNINPEGVQETQTQNMEGEKAAGSEAEDSLARVPSDKAMSLFTTSITGELTPSPSVDEPEAENIATPAPVTFGLQDQPPTEVGQHAVQPASNPPPEVPVPEQKPEVAAGPQQPENPHRSEMVLVLGSQQQSQVSRSPESVPETSATVLPPTEVGVAPSGSRTPTVAVVSTTQPQVVGSKAIVPEVKVITSPIKPEVSAVPQIIVSASSTATEVAESAETVPQTTATEVAKSAETVPQTGPVVPVTMTKPSEVGITEIVPQVKEITPSVKPDVTTVSQVVITTPVMSPGVIKSVEKVPQATVALVTTAKPHVAESTETGPQDKEITPSANSPVTAVPQVAIATPSVNPQVTKVPQTTVTFVTTTKPLVAESSENVPRVTPVKPDVSAAVPQINVIVSTLTADSDQTEAQEAPVPAAPEAGAATCPAHAPRVGVVAEAKKADTERGGTVSNIIKLVKQKSMAMEETLRIPWLYYFAFTVFAAFIAVATDCSPLTYVAIIAVVSLISFRVLVEITCKEEKK